MSATETEASKVADSEEQPRETEPTAKDPIKVKKKARPDEELSKEDEELKRKIPETVEREKQR